MAFRNGFYQDAMRYQTYAAHSHAEALRYVSMGFPATAIMAQKAQAKWHKLARRAQRDGDRLARIELIRPANV